jgi:hypothetical protein
MLLAYPIYQFGILPRLAPESPAVELGFSHAYYGATRHAITVGFVSLMIVGVASRVVPTLNGVDLHALPGLWLPFVLLNFGCALRVTSQTATDFAPWAFVPAGFSGLFEVSGLALWGTHLWLIMAGKLGPSLSTGALPEGSPIEGRHTVGAVLDRYPALLAVFLEFGFQPLANSLLRRALASRVSINRACRLQEVNEERLLEALNLAREPHTSRRVPLNLIEQN